MSDGVVGLFTLFVASRVRHTRCSLVTGVQTCPLPISSRSVLFPNVQARATLCSAMFERNSPALIDCIRRASMQGMTDEDVYYKARDVAARVLDTLTSYIILFAQAASDFPPLVLLDRLQDFLQQCADIGLHGKEVFQVCFVRILHSDWQPSFLTGSLQQFGEQAIRLQIGRASCRERVCRKV